MKTLIVAPDQTLRTLLVHAMYAQTDCIRTIHVPNMFDNAVVKPTMRGECAKHR